MFQSGFLGTNAGFITDFTLVVEILFFVAICIGVVAQRRGQYRLHDWIQTPVVVLNFFLILFVMVSSFLGQRVLSTLPQRPGDAYYLVVAIHAALGLIAELLAIYCLLAGHQILPRRIGRLRYWMWATFVFWTAALITGIATYAVWYVQPIPADTPQTAIVENAPPSQPSPTTINSFLQNFEFTPADLTVVSGSEVVWINQDSAPHNITFVDGSAASDNFFRDESFPFTFTEPGIYQIYCTLHGSADGSGMATTVTVLENNAENAAAAAALPTANPVPPTPTPAPTVPPPPVAPLEQDVPEEVLVGLVSFFDGVAPGDSTAVLLTGIDPPAGGSILEAWLINSQGTPPLSLGEVRPDENGRLSLIYSDPDGRNLPGLYDGFQITLEPQFDDDPTPGPVVYSGRQADQALTHIRLIVTSSDDAPAAYGLGARYQTEELLRHAEFVQTAYDLLSIADARRHAEHLVNLLQGAQGEQFGDLDGVHGIQNPGDGFGILPYVAGMQAAAEAAAAAPDATNAIQVHSSHVVMATDNALVWGQAVNEAALQIIAADDVGEIGPYVETIVRFGDLLLNGADENGDGEIAPIEGGIFTAYQHTQYMAAIAVARE